MFKILQYGSDNLDRVFKRSQISDKKLIDSVNEIVDNVRENGNTALFDYISRFDGVQLNNETLLVSEEEIDAAYTAVDASLIESLRRAKANVLDYHNRQREKFENVVYDKDGNKLGWMYRAMDKVGLYIPGGKASYPSSILMCALPAVAAGVGEVVIATPNPSNPLTLIAARECGVKKIYKMGGAHAIAALAHGTQSVEKVDLIAGPGNVYVTLAKKAVYGHVAIDMIAGPSEILIIADKSANAAFVAADLLSQAEHDEMAASILVTDSRELADAVSIELIKQTEKLSRKSIIDKSSAANGTIILVKDMNEAIEVSDRVAPEHLEICTTNAQEIASKVKNAGAIFVGNYSPEPLGDYFAGPSHCLPTSGSARYFSVLSVDTFMKKISYISYSKDSLRKAAPDIAAIAECEGLTAHANTVKIRFKEENL